MTTPLPTLPALPDDIVTGMDELKLIMTETLERQRSQLLQSRQEVNKILKELEEESKTVSMEIEAHMVRQHELRLQIAELDQRIEDSKGTIVEYSRRKTELETKVEAAQELCDEVRAKLEERQSLRRRQVQHVMEQSVQNVPELIYMEDLLGLKIEAVVDDKLRFVFDKIDPNNYSREFTFVLNMTEIDYAVDECDPSLGPDVVDMVVSRLNHTRNFPHFLKELRQAFKDMVIG